MKLMVHTAVGASFRMETAAASARLGSYLFAGFQQDSLSSEDLKLTKKNLLLLSLKFDNDLETVPSLT